MGGTIGEYLVSGRVISLLGEVRWIGLANEFEIVFVGVLLRFLLVLTNGGVKHGLVRLDADFLATFLEVGVLIG